MALARGDRVRLNSGGPVLIAQEVYSNVHVTCTWMDEMGQRHEREFPRDALRKIEPFNFDQTASNDSGTTLADDGDELSSQSRHSVRWTQLQILAMTIVSAASGLFQPFQPR